MRCIHSILLHGVDTIFPRKQNSIDSSKAGANKSKENTNTSTHAALSDVYENESSKGLLQVAKLDVSSELNSLLTWVFVVVHQYTLECIRPLLTISAY